MPEQLKIKEVIMKKGKRKEDFGESIYYATFVAEDGSTFVFSPRLAAFIHLDGKKAYHGINLSL